MRNEYVESSRIIQPLTSRVFLVRPELKSSPISVSSIDVISAVNASACGSVATFRIVVDGFVIGTDAPTPRKRCCGVVAVNASVDEIETRLTTLQQTSTSAEEVNFMMILCCYNEESRCSCSIVTKAREAFSFLSSPCVNKSPHQTVVLSTRYLYEYCRRTPYSAVPVLCNASRRITGCKFNLPGSVGEGRSQRSRWEQRTS